MADDILLKYKADISDLQAKVIVIENEIKGVSVSWDDAQKKAKQAVDKTGASLDPLAKKLKDLGVIVASAFAVDKIIAFGVECYKAFALSEVGAQKLRAAISANGGMAQDFDILIGQAQELQKTTIFSKEQVADAQTFALQFGLTAKAVQDVIPTITDFASATGQDLTSALQAVFRSLEGDGRMLKLYGITVDQSLSKTDKFKSIVQQLTDKFQGQALVVGNTAQGAVKKLENAWEDLKVTIGAAISPLVEGIAKVAHGFVEMTLPHISENLEKERVALNNIRLQLDDANLPQAERVKLIKELQSKYPDYLKNIDAETVSNKELFASLNKINESLINRIIIQREQEKIDSQNEKTATARKQKLDKEEELLTLINEAHEKFNFTLEEGASIQKKAADAVAFLSAKHASYKTTFSAAGDASDALRQSLGEYRATLAFLSSEEKKGNDLIKEKDRLMKELNVTVQESDREASGGTAVFASPDKENDAQAEERRKKLEEEINLRNILRKKDLNEQIKDNDEKNIAFLKSDLLATIEILDVRKKFNKEIADGEKGLLEKKISLAEAEEKQRERISENANTDRKKLLNEQIKDEDEKNIAFLKSDEQALEEILANRIKFGGDVAQIDQALLEKRMAIAAEEIKSNKKNLDDTLKDIQGNAQARIDVLSKVVDDPKTKGIDEAAEAQKQIFSIQKISVNQQVLLLEYLKDQGIISAEDYTKEVKRLSDERKVIIATENAFNIEQGKKTTKTLIEQLQELSKFANGIADSFSTLFNGIVEDRIASLNAQSEAESNYYDKQQETIDENMKKRLITEAQGEKKSAELKRLRTESEKKSNDEIKKLKTKEAEMAKLLSIFKIGLSLAEAIADADVLKAIAAGVELAVVVATPIPKFFKGTKYADDLRAPAGRDTIPAMINRGERIVPTEQNIKHWDLYEAIDDNKVDEYVMKHQLGVILKAQNKIHQKDTERSFAENVAKSFASESLTYYEADRIRRKGMRIVNEDSLAKKIAHYMVKETTRQKIYDR